MRHTLHTSACSCAVVAVVASHLGASADIAIKTPLPGACCAMRAYSAAGRVAGTHAPPAPQLRGRTAALLRPRAAPLCATALVVTCRVRPGRQVLQRKHREEKLLSNRDALDALRLLGVERIECLRVYGQASEYLYYQANKWDASAPPAAPAAPAPAAAPAEAEDEGSADDGSDGSDDEESREPDESELTVARIDAVVAWMRSAGVPPASIPAVLTAYPAVLAFDVEGRLAPLANYMAELGVNGEQLANAIARRPSLLGLSVTKNLRLMVEYLKSMDTPQEKILEYLLTTL